MTSASQESVFHIVEENTSYTWIMLFSIGKWLARSFILHTLFLTFTTTLQGMYYYPSFPEEDMKCQEVNSLAPGDGAGVQAQHLPLQPFLQ